MASSTTNKDIISKIAKLEANLDNITGEIKETRDDIKQIKKDTANFGLVKSIVFGFIVIILLAFTGVLVELIIPHAPITQANNFPETSIHLPGK